MIYIVDDSKVELTIYDKQLTTLGYKHKIFLCGTDVMTEFIKDPWEVQLVISDYIMPDMYGIALIERMLELRPDLKSVIITGYDLTMTKEDLLKRGIHGFYKKPITIDIMKNMLTPFDLFVD